MKSFLIIIIIILAIACQKPLEIDYPKQSPLLVVNCLFAPDSLFIARISHTAQTNDSTDLSITDANCEIWLDGEKLATLSHTENGFYTNANIKPQVGKAYTIKVTHPNYPTVSATDTVPAKTTVLETGFEHFTDYDILDESYLNMLYIRILDDVTKDNFYQIKTDLRSYDFEYDSTETINDTLYQYSPIYIANNNQAAITHALVAVQLMLFNDKYFNGNNILLNFEYSLSSGAFFYDIPYYQTHDLIITLKNTSSQYYNYVKQLQKHVITQDILANQIYGVGDPVQMTTNIQNGFGVFAAYNTQIFVLHHENIN